MGRLPRAVEAMVVLDLCFVQSFRLESGSAPFRRYAEQVVDETRPITALFVVVNDCDVSPTPCGSDDVPVRGTCVNIDRGSGTYECDCAPGFRDDGSGAPNCNEGNGMLSLSHFLTHCDCLLLVI